jgi:hypothetical protein
LIRWGYAYIYGSCALVDDGRVFAFGRTPGIPAAGAQGVPQLLQEGALAAGIPVCALGTGCWATFAAFIEGPPPAEPGFSVKVIYERSQTQIQLTDSDRDPPTHFTHQSLNQSLN